MDGRRGSDPNKWRGFSPFLPMKTIHAFTSGAFILGLLACSEPKTPVAPPSAVATFDLSGSRLGKTDASSLIKSIGLIAEASREPIIVRFERGDHAVSFEIALTEPEESYQLKPIVKGADGAWNHPKPPASPPGDVDPTWIRLTNRGTVGPGIDSNSDFAAWLDRYVGAIGSIDERSAIVLAAEAGVTCDQLFDVLESQAQKGLDRFLVERHADPDETDKGNSSTAPVSEDHDLD